MTTADEHRAARIEELLHHCRTHGLAVEPGTMFRRPALRSQGKLFAFMGDDQTLIVKLPTERITQLVDDGTAERVTMGKRTMREWASVPGGVNPGKLWEGLALEAHRFVMG